MKDFSSKYFAWFVFGVLALGVSFPMASAQVVTKLDVSMEPTLLPVGLGEVKEKPGEF